MTDTKPEPAERLRVLFLCPQYPPIVWDGAGSYVQQASRALADLGHEVHVLCCLRGQESRDERDGAVFVHRRPMVFDGQFTNLRTRGVLGKAIRGLERTTRSRNYPNDVLLWRFSQALSYWREYGRLDFEADVIEAQCGEPIVFSLRHAVPVLVHLHGPGMMVPKMRSRSTSVRGWIADRFDRWSSRRADLLTAPSSLIARHLTEETGWLGDSVPLVVPHSYVPVPELSDASPVQTTAPVVLAIGRVEMMKGVDVLTGAFDKIGAAHPSVSVRIIGDPHGRLDGRPIDAAIRARAAEAGISCDVPGPLPHAAVLDAYSSARVVVIPSRFDNFPMVGLEAMAAGRPLVCTDRVGYSDLVRDHGAGTVVPAGDAAALAEAIIAYLDDPDHAASTGARGRRLLCEHLRPEVVIDQRVAALRLTIERFEASQEGRTRRADGSPSPVSRA